MPPPQGGQTPELRGLTGEEAKRKLLTIVDEIVRGHEEAYPFLAKTSLCNVCTSAVFIGSLVIGCSMFAGYMLTGLKHYFIEALIILFNAGLNIFLFVRADRLTHQEAVRLLKLRLDQSRTLPCLSTSSSRSLSPDFIHVFRDAKARALPAICLVPGDVIMLRVGQRAPCITRIVGEPAGKRQDQKIDQSLPPLSNANANVRFHKVLVAPVESLLKKLLMDCLTVSATSVSLAQLSYVRSPYKPTLTANLRSQSATVLDGTSSYMNALTVAHRSPPPTFLCEVAAVQRKVGKIMWWGLLVVLMTALVRLGYGEATNSKVWLEALVPGPALVFLPLMALSEPVWLYLLDAIGNALLYTTHEQILKRTDEENNTMHSKWRKQLGKDDKPKTINVQEYSASSKSSISYSSDMDADDRETFSFVDSLHIPWKQLFTVTRDILFGRNQYRTRTVNMLHALGNVTVFCCLDNEGILSENDASADHILFLDEDAGLQVLNLLNDPDKPTGMEFEGEWQDDISSLNPIGLNCILNSTCNIAPAFQSIYKLSNFNSTGPERGTSGAGCMCLLAKEIGFDPEEVRSRFSLRKVSYDILLVRQAESMGRQKVSPRRNDAKICSMTSIAVESMQSDDQHRLDLRKGNSAEEEKGRRANPGPGPLSVLSSGDPSFVLRYCSEYWDGRQVQPLTDLARQRINECLRQWNFKDLTCVAFAFAPVHASMDDVFKGDDRPVSYFIENWECKQASEADFPSQRRRSTTLRQEELYAGKSVPIHLPFAKEDAAQEVPFPLAPPLPPPPAPPPPPPTDRVPWGTEDEAQAFGFTDAGPLIPTADFGALPTADAFKPLRHNRSNTASSVRGESGLGAASLDSLHLLSGARGDQEQQETGGGMAKWSGISGPKSSITEPPTVASVIRSAAAAAAASAGGINAGISSAAGVEYCRNPPSPPPLFASEEKDRAATVSAANLIEEAEDILKSTHEDQVFLGVVALRDQPKVAVMDLVEQLMNAGIRFAYMSPDDERKTLAFGKKIGIFTDFNVSICLKDPGKDVDTLSAPVPTRGFSKMPVGVSAIRQHIEEIDNVPLLISLFTECTPVTSAEMIKIYQENGEVMGSALKSDNTKAFQHADVAACLAPVPWAECPYQRHNRHPSTSSQSPPQSYMDAFEFKYSAAINATPCTLSLPVSNDLRGFTALICEGRRLLSSLIQCLSFGLAAVLLLFSLLLVASVVNLPSIMNGCHVLYFVWIVIPLLASSLLASRRDPNLMRQVPRKNVAHAPDERRFACYFIIRFLPSVVGYIVLFLSMLISDSTPMYLPAHLESGSEVFTKGYMLANYFWKLWSDSNDDMGTLDERFRWKMFSAQNYAVAALLIALIFHSMGFVHRCHGLTAMNPFRNGKWVGVSLLLVLAQSLILAITEMQIPNGMTGAEFRQVHAGVLVAWFGAIVLFAELCKRHDKKIKDRQLKKSKAKFETVLGMFSPK